VHPPGPQRGVLPRLRVKNAHVVGRDLLVLVAGRYGGGGQREKGRRKEIRKRQKEVMRFKTISRHEKI
jgi:hypothetical protein